MAEQATRIKDQSSGDYIATRDAHEQDAENRLAYNKHRRSWQCSHVKRRSNIKGGKRCSLYNNY